MNDVGPQAQPANRLEHGPVEEDEPLAVVVVVLAADLVELVAIEVGRLVDQVDRDVGSGEAALMDLSLDRSRTDRDLQRQTRSGSALGPADQTRRWQGRNRQTLMAQISQCAGQGPGDVGESPGLGEGNTLRGDDRRCS